MLRVGSEDKSISALYSLKSFTSASPSIPVHPAMLTPLVTPSATVAQGMRVASATAALMATLGFPLPPVVPNVPVMATLIPRTLGHVILQRGDV